MSTKPPPRAGKYGAILIDAAWPFDTYSRKGVVPTRRAEQPYKTMQLYEIAGLPVPDFAAKHCAVFLWKPSWLPRAATLLAEVWGFRVVTDDVFVWWKTDGVGMGYWSRKDTETCALLKRGQPPRRSKGVAQIVYGERREHSRKPDEVYRRIERLVDGPYLEMFATQRWPNWDSWGTHVDKFTVDA